MKNFNDLQFKTHPCSIHGDEKMATMTFDNGYGISVITGKVFYTSELKPYEVAVLLDGSLCYTTSITDDVIGHCDKNDISKLMEKIQKLDVNSLDN